MVAAEGERCSCRGGRVVAAEVMNGRDSGVGRAGAGRKRAECSACERRFR